MNARRGRIASADAPGAPPRRRISAAGWRIVLLASLGGTLEFYDFVVFGIFAKDIADAVFPNPTPLVSLMVSFGAGAFRLRRRVRLRHPRRRGGDRREPRRADVAAGRARTHIGLAHRLRRRRHGRPPQLRPAPVARGVAGVRADEAAGRAPAVSR